MQAQSLIDRLDQKVFDAIYSRSLVYNTCWEDPAVDRLALALRPQDRMLVIASAGCNVLDYALVAPACIHAVDANPRQTALLELKLAGIRHLEFEDFFAVFGDGRHPGFAFLYREALRDRTAAVRARTTGTGIGTGSAKPIPAAVSITTDCPAWSRAAFAPTSRFARAWRAAVAGAAGGAHPGRSARASTSGGSSRSCGAAR